MAPPGKATCTHCGLKSTPNADARCPGCGTPVTIDVRDQLPPPARPLPSVEELTARLEAQRTRRQESVLNRQMGPKVIIGALVALALFRALLRHLYRWP